MVQSMPNHGSLDEPAHEEPAAEPRIASRPIAGQRERERERQQHEDEQRVAQETRDREQSDATPSSAPAQQAAARQPAPNDDGKSMIEKAKRGIAAGTQPWPSQEQLDDGKSRALGSDAASSQRRDMQSGTSGSYRTR